MKDIIDMAADRGIFIDQSQSLNLFIANPTIDKLTAMHFYAWKKGLKVRQSQRGAGSVVKLFRAQIIAYLDCSLCLDWHVLPAHQASRQRHSIYCG